VDRYQVLSTIDARMGEVYYGRFQGASADDLVCIGEEKLSAPESIDLPEPQAAMAQWTGIGSGWDTYHQQFLQRSEIIIGSLAFQWIEDKFPNALIHRKMFSVFPDQPLLNILISVIAISKLCTKK